MPFKPDMPLVSEHSKVYAVRSHDDVYPSIPTSMASNIHILDRRMLHRCNCNLEGRLFDSAWACLGQSYRHDFRTRDGHPIVRNMI